MTMEALFTAQKLAFSRGPYPSLAARRDRLVRLRRMLESEGDALLTAIDRDFAGRSLHESQLIELFPSLEGIRYAERHLHRWMKPQRRHVSLWFAPARAEVQYQPKGVVGIVAPWNYPLFLAVGPLTAALAAGNRAMVKLSEYCPAFGEAFAAAIARHFAPDEVAVILGDADVARHFTALPFDHLLFTGSTEVGRHVMAAAAKNLTPVTLELGGKSPAIIGDDFPIATAARRIVFAKLANAGQTCVAPDYLLLPASRRDAFVAAAQEAARSLYAKAERDYAGIITDTQRKRLQALLEDAIAQGARAVPLLDSAPLPGRRLAPQLILDADRSMKIMQEEIFGPLLPVLTYDRIEDALAYVNEGARPLALYVFDHDRSRVDAILAATHSGGVAVNDCLFHVAQDDLPFGGIGASGMGAYHGPEGFKTFSHARGVFRQFRFTGTALLHPPYEGRARLMLKVLLRRWGRS